MSRTKNAFKNMIVSLAYQLFIFAMGFIMPRYIIMQYGDNINGLTQTINRMLSLVALVQAGAVGSAIYQMYVPVAKEDYETQSAIIYASNKFYKRIGIFYLFAAIVISFIYSFLLNTGDIKQYEIILSFIILAVNGSFNFFFYSKYDIFFSSHQKKYYLSYGDFIYSIVYYGILILVLAYKLPFMCMYAAMLIGGISKTVYMSLIYMKNSRGKINRNPSNKNFQLKDRKYLMLSSIGTETITAAPTVIITTFINLTASSIFSVYSMIHVSMKTIINSLQLAVSAIFGNLAASENDEKISDVFGVFEYAFTMIGVFLSSCTAFMFMPFINIYTKNFVTNYSYPVLAMFIVLYISIFTLHTLYGFISTIYGLFKDTCRVTIVCGAIGIILSTVCVILFGMPYVMIGILVYETAYTAVIIRILKKKVAWFTANKAISNAAILILIPIVSYFISKILSLEINNWLNWVITAAMFAIVICAAILIYSLIFEKKRLVKLINYGMSIIKGNKK
ncbi:MAG: hypothetical protein NC452_03665 [Eubacterium sp.]|nr:hypothetical protein [Eubacterium sp.]